VTRVHLSLSRACALALALGSAMAGCTFDPTSPADPIDRDGSIDPPRDGGPLPPDADSGVVPPDDGPKEPDGPPGCDEWPSPPTHFDPCDLPAPSPALNLEMAGTYTYNTDEGTLRDPAGSEIAHASIELPGNPVVRAISVNSLQVAGVARLRAVGSKPLLVASWSSIIVQGAIDVSSNSEIGAGASTGECEAAEEGGQGNEGGGGGGGGGFQGRGGKGGNGFGSSNGGDLGESVDTPTEVRGGCAGARGGLGNSDGGPGEGGAGGGALQLTARVRIDVQGELHAGGAGGQSGCNGGTRSGGGGGGSGGLLDIEAPTIAFGSSARVAANGGGGGEGCQGSESPPGEAGQASDARAQGASGGSPTGGDGGDGSARANLEGTDGGNGGSNIVGDRGSGGGGGAGAGYIILDGEGDPPSGAIVSPPPIRR
jgi:hypothetical protein